ncbi:MAG: thioredoxin [Calditrichaeota bacterium]|nr:thioredoxin [Calditrichota bacterium]
MADYVVVTDDNFENEVAQSNLPVLVDFWAVWCGPCKAIAPIIEELASEYNGRAKIAKVDVDQNQVIAGKYGIRSIPTLVIYKNGEEVDRIIGAVPKAVLEDRLKQQLSA